MQIEAMGMTFEADWVLETTTRHGTAQITIQMPGGTDIRGIITALVGAQEITGIRDAGVRTVYEAYTTLASLIYSTDRRALRLTLEREGEA